MYAFTSRLIVTCWHIRIHLAQPNVSSLYRFRSKPIWRNSYRHAQLHSMMKTLTLLRDGRLPLCMEA